MEDSRNLYLELLDEEQNGEDLEENLYEVAYEEEPRRRPRRRRATLGMTPFQWFVFALLVFMASCLLSTFFLLITGKVVLPF